VAAAVVVVAVVALAVLQLRFLRVMAGMPDHMALEAGIAEHLTGTSYLVTALFIRALVPAAQEAMVQFESSGPAVLDIFLQPEQQTNRKNNGTLHSHCQWLTI